MKLPLPDSLDLDEIADWARHPVTRALVIELHKRWRIDAFKTVSPEGLPRLQGQQEVIDAIDEWAGFASR